MRASCATCLLHPRPSAWHTFSLCLASSCFQSQLHLASQLSEALANGVLGACMVPMLNAAPFRLLACLLAEQAHPVNWRCSQMWLTLCDGLLPCHGRHLHAPTHQPQAPRLSILSLGMCRFCQMMWRLNFLVTVTCIVLENSYMLYYICPMHTIFTVFVYACLALGAKYNSSATGIWLKYASPLPAPPIRSLVKVQS